MPIALEPKETFEIILESDKGKPRETQPRFIYRHLTCRQWRELGRLQDQMELQKNADEVMDKLFAAASTNLVSWVNMVHPQSGPIVFSIKKFEDIITMTEAQEIIVMLIKHGTTPADKKKFDSQSGSDSVISAKTVKARKSVKTSRRRHRQSK